MNKYQNNGLVEPMDAIILLNDNYIHYNLKSGVIGVVVDNFIKTRGYVLADFFHPFTGEDICVQAEIKKEDFRVISNSINDQRKVKEFKDLFKN